MMNIGVGAADIAQRFVEPMRNSFKDKPVMPLPARFGPSNSESKLERHIESRRGRRLTVKLNSRKIMKRVPRMANELENTIKPPLAPGNLNRRVRNQSEPGQSRNKCQVEIFIFFVVWDVDERDVLGRARLNQG